jgi:hypothetical protein
MIERITWAALGIPDLGLFIVKLLAVVGGVAVGAIGCKWFLTLLVRLVTGQKVPERVQKLARLLGAVAIGLLVWTWVFNPGGQGGMGGSGNGWWPFGQGGAGSGNVVEKQPVEPEPAPSEEKPTPKVGNAALTVKLLGGSRVHEQRFYVLDMDSPRNLAELQKAIAERKQANPALGRLVIVIYSDSVDRDNPAVSELKQWAEGHEFQTELSIVSQPAP